MVKSVNTRDLKSLARKACRFDSGSGHFAPLAQLVEQLAFNQ